jgi:hypothetical protein
MHRPIALVLALTVMGTARGVAVFAGPETPAHKSSPRAAEGVSEDERLTPAEFFRLKDVQRYLDMFADGAPVGATEEEPLTMLLEALRGGDVRFIERWAKQGGEFDWRDLPTRSAGLRGQFFTLRGHVTRVTDQRLDREAARRLGFKQFHRCQCEVGDGHRPIVVYALDVPGAWPRTGSLREPVVFQGVYLKLSPVENGAIAAPTFAAVRLAWHPDNLAGRLGLDFGLLESVVHGDWQSRDDRDAFYQLLAGVGRTPAVELDAAAQRAWERIAEPSDSSAAKPESGPRFSIPKIFQHAREVEDLRREMRDLKQLGALAERVLLLTQQKNQAKTALDRAAVESDLSDALEEVRAKAQAVNVPVEVIVDLAELDRWIQGRLAQSQQKLNAANQSPYSQGQPMTFEGTAMRAVRVRVDEPALQERFGLDHYYEVVVFVDLGRRYQLEEGAMQVNTAPVYACLRELPPRMPLGDVIHERVQLSGVFFKVFPYTPKMSEQAGRDDQHLTPLIIGRELTWLPSERRSHYQLALIATAVLLAVLAGIALWSWRTRRADAIARAKLMSRQFKPGTGSSLNDLKLD